MTENNIRMGITIDPGFSTFKIAINDQLIKFSSKILKLEARNNTDPVGAPGTVFLKFPEDQGKYEYMFGDAVEKELRVASRARDREGTLALNSSDNRFSSPLFGKTLQAAIMYSLAKFELSSENKASDKPFSMGDLSSIDLRVGVTLPNDCVVPFKNSVRDFIISKYNFELEIVGEKTYQVNLDMAEIMGEKKIMFQSQVKSAFFYQSTGDDFEPDELTEKLKFPLLVFDGGYKTLGEFFISETLKIEGSTSVEKNAMCDVDEETAVRVKGEFDGSNRPFYANQVQYYVEKHEAVTEGPKAVLVEPIYNQCIEEFSRKAYDDMIDKFRDQINDTKTVLMTGGTGKAYFEFFKTYFSQDFGENIEVVLTDRPYKGKPVDPTFAIVLGLHKVVMNTK